MADQDLKAELAADLDRARARIARNFDALRNDMDVTTHIKQSFHHNKTAYIGGATFLGLLLSKLPSRKKKVFVERKSNEAVRDVEKAGLWLIVLQFLFKTFRPLLTSLLTKQVTQFVRSRAHHAED